MKEARQDHISIGKIKENQIAGRLALEESSACDFGTKELLPHP